jgi:hypothetical protein
MSESKLHHYVPQFYLKRFADSAGRIWVWDRGEDRIFSTGPGSVAAEGNFYWLGEFAAAGEDPLTMEKQFSAIEGEVAQMTGEWLMWIREGGRGTDIPIPDAYREIVSLFLALQFFRTADARSVLEAAARGFGHTVESEEERRALHTQMLWSDLPLRLAGRIRACAWLFGLNRTSAAFVTSDSAVAFRTPDNRMWVKADIFRRGTYLVYPLAPDIVLYCHPDEDVWRDVGVARFDRKVSPVILTEEMVRSENTGQVFMASRFIISAHSNFDDERAFAKTIGTDDFKPD